MYTTSILGNVSKLMITTFENRNYMIINQKQIISL